LAVIGRIGAIEKKLYTKQEQEKTFQNIGSHNTPTSTFSVRYNAIKHPLDAETFNEVIYRC